MSDRTEFIETMRRTAQVMEETQDAHTKYTNASDEANLAFCTFANRYGMRAAERAVQDSLGSDDV